PRPDRPRPVPMPCIMPEGGIERVASNVRVTLEGRVLRYEVEERFLNTGGRVGEADYLFPLPKNAAFQDLKLSINGEMVAGETLDADEARAIYEEIVRRQRDPALVEWMGSGMLRTRIFPIQPGEERRVVVRFQAVAEREGDALRVDYRRGAPREGSGIRMQGGIRRGGADDARDPGNAESLILRYPAGGNYGDAYSPTHDATLRARGGMREVVLRGGGDATVLVPVRGERAGEGAIGVVTQASLGEDGFVLFTIGLPAAGGPGSGTRASIRPRDVTFVVDVSGSMSGEKLRQAQAAGRQLLATLRPADRFRVVAFSSDVRTFEDDFVRASPQQVREASRWIASLDASGGTNIAGALAEALRVGSPRERLPLVVFLTDGEPTVGERDPRVIAERAARGRRAARVYTFGVGSDVNATLLEQLALDGRGTAQFVRPSEDVERAVSLVASRLVDPVLTGVRVRAEGVRLSRMMPAAGSDLFAGQELVVLARFSGRGAGRVIVEGEGVDGPVRWVREVSFGTARDARDNGFVARLWATQRVGWLSAERRRLLAEGRDGGRDGGRGSAALREVEQEMRALGERYGIPTELTSYFVKEPGMVMTRRDVAGGIAGQALPPTVAPMPAAAPMDAAVSAPSSGAGASGASRQFEAAKAASAQRAARTMAEVNVAAEGAAETRMAMGRSFTRDAEGRWVDSRTTAPGATVYRVKGYGAGYFALLRAMPALQEAFALGERVRIAGKGVVVEIGEEGSESLDAGQVRAIVNGLK
ncbi:MAG TPA: VIT domain-containing protein, partial [Gemmatimonadaceae bacterium]